MTYAELKENIESLQNVKGVDFFTIGYSLLGEPIYGVHVGSYEGKQILIEGAIHAREWVTSLLIVEMATYYATQNFRGGMYFIPMVNPDGVRLVLDGVKDIQCEKLREFLKLVNNGSEDFSLWKANANGVDLNVNFDALWGKGTQNVFCLAPANFVGYYPNSEREVQTLMDFTNQVKPDITLSYHTKGEVIDYGFETLNDAQLARDYAIAVNISDTNGYPIVKTSGSVGGYSDWVSLNLGVPAFTIEVGNSALPHPIGIEALPTIYEQNKEVPRVALASVYPSEERYRRRNIFSLSSLFRR